MLYYTSGINLLEQIMNFVVEYRTIGQNGRAYASQMATVGSHKANSAASAAAYVVQKFGRVEVLSVRFFASV